MKTVPNNIITRKTVLEPVNKDRLVSLCGPIDDNLKQIERRLGVQISYKNEIFSVTGTEKRVQSAIGILQDLYIETAPLRGRKVKDITPDDVHLAITEARVLDADTEENSEAITEELNELYHKSVTIKTKKGIIKPRSGNQSDYIGNILSHDISFGIGPAGTGKTYLAVEAGEKLGFLPGDLNQKVDPYLRPLYDALFEMLGFEKVEKLMEHQIIEVAPLAYMRGRTLNDSFIILDESQNTTVEQMKMFLTRIGFNSKAVVTGDITQIDLPRNVKSGLKHAIEVLSNIDDISFNFFTSEDVVRHPIVAKIVRAYEEYDMKSRQDRNDATGFERPAKRFARSSSGINEAAAGTAGPVSPAEAVSTAATGGENSSSAGDTGTGTEI